MDATQKTNCYNGRCGDEGACSLGSEWCPVAQETEAYWMAYFGKNVAAFAPPTMTQEDRAAHFAWERGNGRDPEVAL